MRGKCGANVALYARAGEGTRGKRGKSAYTRPPECGRVGVPRGLGDAGTAIGEGRREGPEQEGI